MSTNVNATSTAAAAAAAAAKYIIPNSSYGTGEPGLSISFAVLFGLTMVVAYAIGQKAMRIRVPVEVDLRAPAKKPKRGSAPKPASADDPALADSAVAVDVSASPPRPALKRHRNWIANFFVEDYTLMRVIAFGMRSHLALRGPLLEKNYDLINLNYAQSAFGGGPLPILVVVVGYLAEAWLNFAVWSGLRVHPALARFTRNLCRFYIFIVVSPLGPIGVAAVVMNAVSPTEVNTINVLRRVALYGFVSFMAIFTLLLWPLVAYGLAHALRLPAGAAHRRLLLRVGAEVIALVALLDCKMIFSAAQFELRITDPALLFAFSFVPELLILWTVLAENKTIMDLAFALGPEPNPGLLLPPKGADVEAGLPTPGEAGPEAARATPAAPVVVVKPSTATQRVAPELELPSVHKSPETGTAAVAG